MYRLDIFFLDEDCDGCDLPISEEEYFDSYSEAIAAKASWEDDFYVDCVELVEI